MNNSTHLIIIAVGGVFVFVLLYAIRDYIVIGLVSAGAICIYKLVSDSNDKNRRG